MMKKNDFLKLCDELGYTSKLVSYNSLARHFFNDYKKLDSNFYKSFNDDYFRFFDLLNTFCSLNGQDIKVIQNYARSNYCRYKRLYNKVYSILDYEYVYFLTFTFDDKLINIPLNELSYNSDIFNKFRLKTRDTLTRLLNTFCIDYVGNEDFGSKNDRFHYHVLVACNDSNSLNLAYNWPYGFIDIQVRHNNNVQCLSQYVNKLARHSIKTTNKRCNLIYPRVSRHTRTRNNTCT